MSKKIPAPITILTILIFLLACLPSSAAGEELTPEGEYAVGYQFSRPASGFTVKIPISGQYFLQPVFAFTLVEKQDLSRKNLALGLRAISNLPAR